MTCRTTQTYGSLSSFPPNPLYLEVDVQEAAGDPAQLLDARKELALFGADLVLDNASFGPNDLETLVVLRPAWVKITTGAALLDDGQRRQLRRMLNVARSLAV